MALSVTLSLSLFPASHSTVNLKPSKTKTTAAAFAQHSKAASRLSLRHTLKTRAASASLDLSPHRGPSFRPSSPTSTNALLTVKLHPYSYLTVLVHARSCARPC
ncbi:hypothetical protein CI102_13544 [Trichoderma harzianum]|nr:hypothetical protein CI102_13544 [Trichoderma harzianum]